MKVVFRVSEAGGWRDISESDFPLAIKVSDQDGVLFGNAAESSPDAWLGYDHNRDSIFIQPSVLINGELLKVSAWLSDGNEIRIAGESFSVTLAGDVLGLMPAVRSQAPMLIPPAEDHPVTEQLSTSVDNADAEEELEVLSSVNPLPRKKHRPARRVITGIFLLLIAGVLFVLTAAPIKIGVNPRPDSLSLTGYLPAIKIGERYLVLPGSYNVLAEKDGYRDLEKSLDVDFGSEVSVTYQMQKLPGLLNVRSQPVSGAEVRIDGHAIGKTPAESIEIEAGRHELLVTVDRYLPYTHTIDIKGMGETQIQDIKLEPAWGELIVSSKPEGADVWLNGESIGQTRLQYEPMAGEYGIELRKEGWKRVTEKVQIKPGEVVELPIFQLTKVDGVLKLTSNPTGANATLDNEFQGRTPITLNLVSGMEHRLNLSKNGFTADSRTVIVGSEEAQTLDIDLKPEYGIVFITSRPADAQLKVDGEVVGSASRRLRLNTSAHRIEISKSGYETYTTTVTPSKSNSKKLNVRLEAGHKLRSKQVSSKSIPSSRKPTGKVKTKAKWKTKTRAKGVTAEGQVLRLIRLTKPVRLEMGASRRQAGRRANETQYMIELSKSYLISEKEVTNKEFKRFQATHNSGTEQGVDLNGPLQPVASVSWDAAARYMNWLSMKDRLLPAYREENGNMRSIVPLTTGYRLPTEAEWAFAARYEGGHRASDNSLKYPWGGSMPPSINSGNYADSSAAGKLSTILNEYTDNYSFAAPAGRFEPNALGIYDLGGNVTEWCHDFYSAYNSTRKGILHDPDGPSEGKYHVIRGSSWRHGSVMELRFTYRDYAMKPRNDLGFRIARYAD